MNRLKNWLQSNFITNLNNKSNMQGKSNFS